MVEEPTGAVETPAPGRRFRLAAHERRTLLLEMVSVIAGVLIALFVDQLAGEWRDRRRAYEFRDMVREEIRYNSGWYSERLAVSACIDRRLSLLDSHVEALAVHRKVAPFLPRPPVLGGRLNDEVWIALQASGSLPNLSLSDQKLFSGIYGQQRDIRDWQVGEGQDWMTMSLANKPAETLTPEDVSRLRLAVASAQRWNYLQRLNAARQISRAVELKIAPPDYSNEQHQVLAARAYAMCADVGMAPSWPAGYAPPKNMTQANSVGDISPVVSIGPQG